MEPQAISQSTTGQKDSNTFKFHHLHSKASIASNPSTPPTFQLHHLRYRRATTNANIAIGGILNYLSHSPAATFVTQNRRTIMGGAVPIGQSLVGMNAGTCMIILQLTVRFHFRKYSTLDFSFDKARGSVPVVCQYLICSILHAIAAVAFSPHGQATTTRLKKLFNKNLHFRNSTACLRKSVNEL